VAIEFQTEAEAIRFEKYLKSGSGRAFAKRHFGAGWSGRAKRFNTDSEKLRFQRIGEAVVHPEKF
jgi:hypothetical protein